MNRLGLEFKVGLFTVVAIITIAYMFYVLNPKSFEGGSSNTYYTILKDASGITQKTHVKTNGVIVGVVQSVELETNQTRVYLEVDANVKVPVGSKVDVRTVGLLGDKFIEIIRTKDDGQYHKDGDLLERFEEGADVSALIGLAGGIAKDVKKITSVLARILGSDQGEKSIEGILENVHGLTDNLNALVEKNKENLSSVVENLQKTTAAFSQAIGNHANDMEKIVVNLKGATDSLAQLLDTNNKDKIERILANFDASMTEVQQASRNVRLIADRVERGDGTLGRLLSDDTALKELEGAIKDVREVLAPASRLEIDVDYHNELRKDKTTQNYFNLVFKTRPDRFYLLGLSDHKVETITRTTENVQSTGDETAKNKTSTIETVKQEKAMRFNLQFAKRWLFAGLRFGLFESTGGLASDVYLLSDKIRMSVEAFNFDTTDSTIRKSAHFKAYGTFIFLEHLYAVAGLDDLTKLDTKTGKRQDPNYFFGAGLTFNDQDLKALFGAASLAK